MLCLFLFCCCLIQNKTSHYTARYLCSFCFPTFSALRVSNRTWAAWWVTGSWMRLICIVANLCLDVWTWRTRRVRNMKGNWKKREFWEKCHFFYITCNKKIMHVQKYKKNKDESNVLPEIFASVILCSSLSVILLAKSFIPPRFFIQISVYPPPDI